MISVVFSWNRLFSCVFRWFCMKMLENTWIYIYNTMYEKLCFRRNFLHFFLFMGGNKPCVSFWTPTRKLSLFPTTISSSWTKWTSRLPNTATARTNPKPLPATLTRFGITASSIPISASWPARSPPPRSNTMGAPRVTPEEIVEMQQLYAILRTYAAVGRAMNPKRSASSVAKYIKMEGVSRNIRIAVENLSQKG